MSAMDMGLPVALVQLCATEDAALNRRQTEAWLERAFIFNTGGSMAAAADCYQQVLALEPDNPHAHAGLAGLAARDGAADRARHHAQAALASDPGNAIAAAALAAVELESGQAAAARDLIAPLAAQAAPPSSERIQLLTAYGDALARCGAPEAAFAAYSEAQTGFARLHELPAGSRETHHDLIERLMSWFDEIQKLQPETAMQLMDLGSKVTKVLEMRDALTGRGRARKAAERAADGTTD